MTYEKLCEMAESKDVDEQIALFKKYRDKDCTTCSEGHSYDFVEQYVEPCECLKVNYEYSYTKNQAKQNVRTQAKF